MPVRAGGAQPYRSSPFDKIRRPRTMLDERGLYDVEMEIDGVANVSTIGEIAAAGTTVCVAGSAVFNQRASVAENLADLRVAAALPILVA